MTETITESQKDIYKIILDKLLIAMVIGIMGFVFSHVLEKYKSKPILFNEIARQQTGK